MTDRPFNFVARGLELWKDGDTVGAEAFLRRGVDAYRNDDPSDTAYALGRLGAFLLSQGRTTEAEPVLAEAINAHTDIPAIWGDYISILARRADAHAVHSALIEMGRRVRGSNPIDAGLRHARRALRERDVAFAEDLTRLLYEDATKSGDDSDRWSAIGTLGEVLEKRGQVTEAVPLWKEAFAAGSRDPTTAKRLSKALEDDKDFVGAARVIRDALRRELPAAAEEQLRKRLVRCEDRAKGRGRSVRDVAAFTVRYDEEAFDLIFQKRVRPPVRSLSLVGEAARCVATAKGSVSVVDIDASTGEELRRVDNLPTVRDVEFAPTGWGLGIRRTARIGEGPTELFFLAPDLRVISQTSIPDASSQAASAHGIWYVGCRDGGLYAFDAGGRPLWCWRTPGADETVLGGPYFRPCPYYVAATEHGAVVSSMGTLFGIGPDGHQRWMQTFPNESRRRFTISVPYGQAGPPSKPYETLGLPLDAGFDQVKRAYRRLALETHPDRTANDPNATERFIEVQSAYEAICAGLSEGTAGTSAVMTIEMAGPSPLVSFIAASADGAFAGTSRGRLYALDRDGQITAAKALGQGMVKPCLGPDGSLAAAWCDGALQFFDGATVVNAVEVNGFPGGLMSLSDEIVYWSGSQLHVADQKGQRIWDVEFAKRISTVTAVGDQVLCAAGVVTAFRRRL